MNDEMNPRAVLGGNAPPDWAKLETQRLENEYVGFKNTLRDIVVQIDSLPESITDDPTALIAGGLIKRLSDLDKRIEQTRVVEVEPNLRRQNAANSFFNSMRRMIQPDDKKERIVKPGLIDQIQKLINEHQARKEAAERERLEQERLERERAARIAREAEEKRQREAAAAAREAQEKQAAADRARNAETRAQKQREADEAAAVAAAHAAEAKAAEVTAQAATDEAQAARIGTLASTADIVRTRGTTVDGGGVTLTSKKEPYCFMIDRTKLDPVKLFSRFTDKEVEKALRSWARDTDHRESMDGAEIGWKNVGVTR